MRFSAVKIPGTKIIWPHPLFDQVLRGFLKEAYRLDAEEWALNSLNDMLASVLMERTRCAAKAHLHDETIEAADATCAFMGSLDGAADYNQLMNDMRSLKADAQVGLDRIEDAINTLEVALKESEAVRIPGGIHGSGDSSPTSSNADRNDSRGSSGLEAFFLEASHYHTVQFQMQIGVSLHRLYSRLGADDKARYHMEKAQALIEEEKGGRWMEQLHEKMNTAATRGDSAFSTASPNAAVVSHGAYAMGRSEGQGTAAAKAAPRGQKNGQGLAPASNPTFVALKVPESSQNESNWLHWSRESSETGERESEADIAMPTAFVALQAAEKTSSGSAATSPFTPPPSTYVPSATSAFRSTRPSPRAESADEPASGQQMDEAGSTQVRTTTATTASSLSLSTDGKKSKNREACLQYSDLPVPSLPLVNSRLAPPAVLSEISSMINNAPKTPPTPSTTPSSMLAEVDEAEASSAREVPDNKGKKDNTTTVVTPPPVRAGATSPQLSATLDTTTVDGPSAGPFRCARRGDVLGGVLTT